MANVILKNYQSKTLQALKSYLETARFKKAKLAYDQAEKQGVRVLRPYSAIPELPEVPFVCLRLPTGGGKTLLSAHCIKIASDAFLERPNPLVLWLVPSSTIRDQTIETLQDPNNANYEALNSAFGGNFKVINITDFDMIKPHDLANNAIIVVGTVQSIKTEETNADSRKVYAHNENLEPLFTKVPSDFTGYDVVSEGDDQGKMRFSFVNLLRLYQPLVLVDEAHNNSTKLGLELFSRINASCVIEFTATPAPNSNILHSVSASELKAEEMIKLPIVLTEHSTWQKAIRDSILNRSALETLCVNEPEYIRPIVLFQAESQGDDKITWQTLKQHLMDEENIPEEKIAVVTGDQRELNGINLFDRSCPIDFVITVQALKEGWDCSFAYVFCSLTNTSSRTAVEQLLGRVLRMPYAKRRKNEDLNRAYAHVSSQTWPNAVKLLHDKLVDDMGFNPEEADDSIEVRQSALNFGENTDGLYRQPEPLVLQLAEPIAITDIPEKDRSSVEIEETKEGIVVKLTGNISPEVEQALINKLPVEDKARAKIEIKSHQAAYNRYSAPSNRGEKFVIPQLALRIDGELDLPEEETFVYAGGWKLVGPAKIGDELTLEESSKTFVIDIDGEKIRHSYLTTSNQLNLNLAETDWTINHLSQVLNKQLQRRDVPHAQMLEYIRSTIDFLIEERKMPLAALVRAQGLLRKVLTDKINQERQAAKERGYSKLLFEDSPHIEISSDFDFSFEPNTYFPKARYQGRHSYPRHFYPVVGDMNKEEAECAQAIEMLGDKIKYWVRNLEKDPVAFRLPTSTDYFYPDFIVQLANDKILVIEYKGEHIADSKDTKEKVNIGQVWAKKTGNLFLLVRNNANGQDVYKQLSNAVSS